jgi:hypothetical protein
MTATLTTTTGQRPTWQLPLLGAALAGAAVATALGAYGRIHTPSRWAVTNLTFSGVINMKVWLATLAFALVLFQLVSALWMYGRLPFAPKAPAWLGTAHRLSGATAFVMSLPIAYHCLYSIGYRYTEARVLAHSAFGCAFFGAFTLKMLSLRIKGRPGWVLPIAGSLVFVALTGLWLTSALWFFSQRGFPSF